MTYTQGPWTIESMSNDLNDGQAEVILANRKTIAWTSNTEVSPIDPMYERLNDDGLLDGSCGYTSDEDRANARLIASAPDLLEALQIVRRDIEAYCEDHNSEHPTDVTVCLPTLQIAIAKAIGIKEYFTQ